MVYVMGRAVTVALKHGYDSLYEGEAEIGIDAGPMLIAGFLIPAVVFMVSGSRNSRITAYFAMGSIVAYFVTVLIWDAWPRCHAADWLIWIYDRCVRRLSRAPLITLGLIVCSLCSP